MTTAEATTAARGNSECQRQCQPHCRAARRSSSSTACITRAVKFDGTFASGSRKSSSRNSCGSLFMFPWVKNRRQNKVAGKIGRTRQLSPKVETAKYTE